MIAEAKVLSQQPGVHELCDGKVVRGGKSEATTPAALVSAAILQLLVIAGCRLTTGAPDLCVDSELPIYRTEIPTYLKLPV